VVVDVHNVEFRRSFICPVERPTDHDFDPLASAHRSPGDFGAGAIDEHAAKIDHRSRFSARQSGDTPGNHLIQAQTSFLFGNLETSSSYEQRA